MDEGKYDKLVEEARDLGIPTNSGVLKPRDEAWHELEIGRWELYRRIQEERRHLREHRLWIVALVSAGASAISALTALVAVFVRH